MASIPCNIVLLPSEELAERAIAISHTLQEFGAHFALSTTGPFPHVSLYMVQLKTDDLDKVSALLADIASKTPVIDLAATGFGQEWGYIDADYTRTPVVDDLQMMVIGAVNPIRDGLRANDQARLHEVTGTVRENLEAYGYRSVGELFRPHITFTRFTDSEPIVTHDFPDPSEFRGSFTGLGLFEMGGNGTCIRKIAEFPFRA